MPGDFAFSAELIYWRGPAPFHFLAVPPDHSRDIEDIARTVSYGWGMIPVVARAGATEWTTSLWPKDGRYLLPVKTAVRRAEGIELGEVVSVTMRVEVRS